MESFTTYTNTPADILAHTKGLLAGVGGPYSLQVSEFNGTTFQHLFDYIDGLNLSNGPAAIVVWEGVDANQTPGRPLRVYHTIKVLILAAHAQEDERAAAARAMAWVAAGVLDNHIGLEHGLWRVNGMAAVDMSKEIKGRGEAAPFVTCYLLDLEVGDR